MAYKRSSKTTPGKTRTTTTHNSKGGITTSVSSRSGNQRTTRSSNSKTGVSYQTTTRNIGGGWIEKKRVRTSPPKVKPINWSKLLGTNKKKKATAKTSSSPKGGSTFSIFIGWIAFAYFIYYIYSFFA